jgi:hypothetical protein
MIAMILDWLNMGADDTSVQEKTNLTHKDRF